MALKRCDYLGSRVGGPLLAGKSGEGIGDMGEHVEEVAFFGVDNLLHFGELVVAEALIGKAFRSFHAGVGSAPEGAEFGFVLEEIGQLAEEHFHELLRGHGRAVGMPEGGGHHVLDGAGFAVGEFDFDLLAGAVTAGSGIRCGAGRSGGSGAVRVPGFGFGFEGFAVPFRDR